MEIHALLTIEAAGAAATVGGGGARSLQMQSVVLGFYSTLIGNHTRQQQCNLQGISQFSIVHSTPTHLSCRLLLTGKMQARQQDKSPRLK